MTDVLDPTSNAGSMSATDFTITPPSDPTITPPSDPTITPPSASPDQPPTPPPSADAPAESGRSPRRSGRRFVSGLATGIALSAATVGGVALVNHSNDGAGDDPPAAVTDAVDSAAATSAADPQPGVTATLVPEGSSVHDLVVAVRPSIVAIHTTITQTDFFGQSVEGEAAGSGWVWSADGYIVTNSHVVDGATDITVTLGDGSSETAELIAADPRSDLAVLRVDRTDLVPLLIGDSDAINVGDSVVAIGNALDLGAEPTVTGGIVSAKERSITEPSGQVLVHLIQTDAAISAGNSGGPLLDLQGRVVGINTAVATQGQNIGFAIAINPAKELIDQLRSGEAPRHALLGVSTSATADPDGGALIQSVENGSGADDAGIRAGDVITSIAGDTITGPQDLVVAIAGHQPGDTVEITLRRDGEDITVSALLGAHDEVQS